MPTFVKHPVPHLLGQVNYSKPHRFQPDGDTIHLLNPVLLVDGQAIPPTNGKFQIYTTGSTKPRTIRLKGKEGNYHAPVRLEGIDASEEHYRANPFKLKIGGQEKDFPRDPAKDQSERCQPKWSPATRYTLSTLEKAGWALVMIDREVTDYHGRVLGYVYSSDARGRKKTFVTLQLLKKGLAFPFLFESAQNQIPTFLSAAEKAYRKRLGVWKNYAHEPLSIAETFHAPKKYTDEEPLEQLNTPLNFPVVFRRVVDAFQLKGLSLELALQKYDAMDFQTGDVLPGDQYHRIPVERLIWAPHQFT